MGYGVKTLFCFLVALSCFCLGFSIERQTVREGTCTDSSQIVFLEPPSDFSSRFEVAGCYCEYGEKVLFLLRNANKPQGSSWCAPGGKLEPGETPLQAIIRELREEIGVVLDEKLVVYCRPVYVRFPSTEFILHLFRFSFSESPPSLRLAVKEHTDYRWVTYEEVSKLDLIPGGKECFCIAFKDRFL